jgi:hypothetical protein
MSRMQRRKGQVGEREAAALIAEHTGWAARRRVRNAAGDSDLVDVPGWAIEVKRHRVATAGVIAGWWQQAAQQADGQWPLLLYRLDRSAWRAVWPLAVSLRAPLTGPWQDYEWTVEGSVAAWAALARGLVHELALDKAAEDPDQ